MKQLLLTIFILLSAFCTTLKAQKPDSIFFNLYTDSLKKGTFNYINVDGKFSNGRWLPLTAKQISFSASGGRFEENSLFIDKDYREEKITVTAVVKADTSIHKSVTIYIKRNEETEKLKTADEIMREMEQQPAEKRGKKRQ